MKKKKKALGGLFKAILRNWDFFLFVLLFMIAILIGLFYTSYLPLLFFGTLIIVVIVFVKKFIL